MKQTFSIETCNGLDAIELLGCLEDTIGKNNALGVEEQDLSANKVINIIDKHLEELTRKHAYYDDTKAYGLADTMMGKIELLTTIKKEIILKELGV